MSTKRSTKRHRKLYLLVTVAAILALLFLRLPPRPPLPKATPEVAVADVDLHSIVRPERMTTILEPEVPWFDRTFLLIAVCSDTGNLKQRQAIRDTWGEALPAEVSLVFVVGRSANPVFEAAIMAESEWHRDVVQEDFRDTYDNLTVKSVMMLKWILQDGGRPLPDFVLKTDDDVYVNVPGVLGHLRVRGRNGSRTAAGYRTCDPVVDRDPDSKFYVSPAEFPGSLYPDYLSGPSYVISGDLIRPLYEAAFEIRYFRFEDVFLTGMCLTHLGLEPENVPGFVFLPDVPLHYCHLRHVISIHKMAVDDLYRIRKILAGSAVQQCGAKYLHVIYKDGLHCSTDWFRHAWADVITLYYSVFT